MFSLEKRRLRDGITPIFKNLQMEQASVLPEGKTQSDAFQLQEKKCCMDTTEDFVTVETV